MAWSFFKSPKQEPVSIPQTYNCWTCDIDGLTWEERRSHDIAHEKERRDYEQLKENNIKACHEIVSGFIGKQNPTAQEIARVQAANEYLRTMLAPKKSITVNTAPRTYDGPDWPGVL